MFDVPVLPGQTYYGNPTQVSMRVAFSFSGGVLIELLQQTNDGTSLFRDFLTERGEGLHHVMPRCDYDKGVARLSAAGHKVAFAGTMPGGERFCLFDTRAATGPMSNSWNCRTRWPVHSVPWPAPMTPGMARPIRYRPSTALPNMRNRSMAVSG